MFDTTAIIETLAADERIESVYLLGSAARDRLRPDSDVDLAVMPSIGRRLDALDRGRLAADLATKLGRDVDLGMLSSANLVYARQAILTGRRLFARNPGQADLRAATLLGMYERFNLDRREVADAYTT